ncbi:hypothetical protein SDC9_07897 [bioreactor metagenome]|uniref:L,D-TPase catalytic domain-containing protein n=1 Tax=bioreactor metagenome TaxID=1076179 RepID=A0A644T5S4_9ZZZZ|nr:L,D-transpeptidase [Candidatus Elulimicrobiales bacterium]
MKKNTKIKSNKDLVKILTISVIVFTLLLLIYLAGQSFIKNDSFNLNTPLSPIEIETSSSTEENLSSTETTSTTTEETASTTKDTVSIITKSGKYVEVIDSCDAHFGGTCVRARACPSVNCPVVTSLRTGMVLKSTGEITEADGVEWSHIVFDEWVRYSDRLASEWYVSTEYLKDLTSEKTRYAKDAKVENLTNKKIIVDRSEQKLYAYDGDTLFMEVLVSTGLDDLPTPRGNFNIFEKTPSRYMQGPLPGISEQYYDLPGVPWTMYFTYQGGAIHGAYWHDKFGSQWSHGCVNLVPTDSEKLYEWADLGTTVVVRD